ncbi:hypothetical protein [Leekyejoonella antrihumi]|uniref:Amidinotransferase n=1 Tax=Leekyejoonella antrihumi TaxID=1660198 RepID=A0A563E736_9MICO|nr:hypothetical protein [Leekyejoonella antrihumi]TWP38245.1 hypothetical protein FGL98_03225 [Leekyejoonella antrihumi]
MRQQGGKHLTDLKSNKAAHAYLTYDNSLALFGIPPIPETVVLTWQSLVQQSLTLDRATTICRAWARSTPRSSSLHRSTRSERHPPTMERAVAASRCAGRHRQGSRMRSRSASTRSPTDATLFWTRAATGLADQLRERGYQPIPIDLSELVRAGGSLKCWTMEVHA